MSFRPRIDGAAGDGIGAVAGRPDTADVSYSIDYGPDPCILIRRVRAISGLG
jgi:hypothetical protein